MKRICIVGSGVAGSILALELAERGACEVTVIDIDNLSRPFTRDLRLDVKFDESSFGNIRQTTGYGFGGTSNLWHGVLADLDEEDYEVINEREKDLDRTRQGIITGRLEKYFGNLESLYSNEFHVDRSALSKFIDFNYFLPKNYLVKVFPRRFRQLLVKKLAEGNKKFRLIQDAVAIEIKLNQNSVSAVRCAKDTGIDDIQADIFVLCAGALETPRILMQSLSGTEFFNELIGKCLIDHPVVFIGELNLPRRVLYRFNGAASYFASSGRRIGFRIPKERRTKKNLNHSIFVRPNIDRRSKEFRENIFSIIYGSQRWRDLFNLLRGETCIPALTLLLEKLGVGYFSKNFLISAQLEQSHYDGGHVALSDEIDKFGRRIPIVSNFASEQLIDEANHLADLFASAIKGAGKFTKYPLDRATFISGSHHAGTCRMGDDPSYSVIDANLKYHYLSNLYICDNSIFPKIGNANISYPLSQYAVKLAKGLSTM
jgi:choline dehydrogenase-like flavoprotein